MKNQKRKIKCAKCANIAPNTSKALVIKALNTQRARNSACVGRVGLNVSNVPKHINFIERRDLNGRNFKQMLGINN